MFVTSLLTKLVELASIQMPIQYKCRTRGTVTFAWTLSNYLCQQSLMNFTNYMFSAVHIGRGKDFSAKCVISQKCKKCKLEEKHFTYQAAKAEAVSILHFICFNTGNYKRHIGYTSKSKWGCKIIMQRKQSIQNGYIIQYEIPDTSNC